MLFQNDSGKTDEFGKQTVIFLHILVYLLSKIVVSGSTLISVVEPIRPLNEK